MTKFNNPAKCSPTVSILNSLITNTLYKQNITPALYCIFLAASITGCSAIPEKPIHVNIPVPVVVPCKAEVAKPELCQPKDDSRPEWLRCELVNHERMKAYAAELEAVLKACQ